MALTGIRQQWQAALPAQSPAAKPRVERKLIEDNLLWNKVSDGLKQEMSPEQISGTLGRMSEPIRLCHETIYQEIYALQEVPLGDVIPKGELRTKIIALLGFGHRKHQP